jgi:hypothetical protein
MGELLVLDQCGAIWRLIWATALTLVVVSARSVMAAEPCRVEVVDRENGWPVPLVELRTTSDIVLVTDNAGLIAVDQPDLLNREIWFDVSGHGYGVRPDGFGSRGVRVTPRSGETVQIEVDRTVIAKRLGRLTGGGIFAESQKLGERRDWQESGVFGCDTVQVANHRGRRFWLWGDTDLPSYRLGVFDSTSATTALRPIKKFEPPLALQYDYFRNEKGVPRGVADFPGEGPTWIGGYVSLPDRDGQARLVATYSKIRPPLEAYEAGLCVWNDDAEKFELLRKVWTKNDAKSERPLIPNGHPALWRDENGQEWLLLGNPLPNFRCPATFEAWQDAATWEKLEPQETLPTVDGGEVKPHTGSIAWNEYRGRWVTVFMESFGKPSAFGELWYAEADAPTGPWGPAVKVLSHDNYTFYNPRLHAELTDAKSPVLLFEGTYTTTFADRPQPTPRYDYNQILYRLDLDDPRLAKARGDE